MADKANRLDPIAQEFLNRLKDSIERTSALGRVSHWLESNTRLAGRPYSFDGHEFQREIIDSTHPNVVVRKPSQVGMSEGIARLGLGFLAVSPDIVAIYTLPTVNEALRFAKSRMDPVIRGSKYLSSALVNGNDSSSFKQIGSSQLFMAGTFGKALISIPTDLLISDEVDFSNPEVLITAESRLSHSRLLDETLEIRGIRRKFSTPTLPRIGISALYDKSDQRKRLVKCKHCGDWSWPDLLQHLVVPGYDGHLVDLDCDTIQELDNRGLIDKAQILCEHCHQPLTKANLQPEYREWVAETPSVKAIQGYAVSPFDLPSYHTPSSLLRKRLEYGDQLGHFLNFGLGVPHADAANSVLPAAVANNTCLYPMYPDAVTGHNFVMGLDVGKTSWLLVGKPIGRELHVVWAEQIRISVNQEDMLFETVVTRMKQFRIVKLVVDALPYTDTMQRIQKQFAEGQVLLCTYTLRDSKTAIYNVRESDYVIEANRTKSLDVAVKEINTDKVKFARFPDLGILTTHFQGLKRVDRALDTGETASEWLKTGPDHYLHAFNYLLMAAKLVTEYWAVSFAPSVHITEAFVGRQAELEDALINPLDLFHRDRR